MGESRISNVPTYWGARVRTAGVRLARTPTEATAGKQLVDRDGERASARQNRLGEARPTVPDPLSWLMLVAVLMVLAVLSIATLMAVGPVVQIGLVLAAAVAFASTLILINDLDQPYTGALGRDPTQTEFVRDQIAAEVRGPLPCDSSGLPLDAAGFRPATPPSADSSAQDRAYAEAASIEGSSDSDSIVPSPSTSPSGGSSPPRSVPAISSSLLFSEGTKPDFMPK